MSKKVTIVNAQGQTLRYLEIAKFNTGTEKKPFTRTFSAKGNDPENGVFSKTIEKALALLKEKGFDNLQVIFLDEDEEAPAEIREKAEKESKKNKAAKGQVAPELEEFLKETTKGMTGEEAEANREFWSGINEKCIGCTRSCRQSQRVTIAQCLQYSKAV